MPNDAEHFLMCLLVVHISSLEKSLNESFGSFSLSFLIIELIDFLKINLFIYLFLVTLGLCC